jgi:hypothetical protein
VLVKVPEQLPVKVLDVGLAEGFVATPVMVTLKELPLRA